MPSVVTANHLRSGEVVYLSADGRWVGDLGQARIASSPEQLKVLEAQALAAIEANEVTAVYAFDVKIIHGRPAPASVRERIRAAHAPTA